MIEVQVKLYGVLRRRRPETVGGAPHHPFAISLSDRATVGDLLDVLDIDHTLVNGVAVNGQSSIVESILENGDDVRLFPPSAGGQKAHVFIAGIMQGSRADHLIGDQNYRQRIADALEASCPGIRISDPYTFHPDSVNYEMDRVRDTFESMTSLAGQADVLIAYLPTASMGTAIEMWTAYHANKYVIAVTELRHNWVVKVTADEVVPDLESLLEMLENGHLAEVLNPRH